jgi:hypothetical protein
MQRLDAVLAVFSLVGATGLLLAGCGSDRLAIDNDRPRVGVHPPTHFEHWTDEDETEGTLDKETFGEALASLYIFPRWDRNADRALDRYEFTEQVFRVWDDNGDGRVSTREWAGAARAWYRSERGHGEFFDWDVDRSRFISRGEFAFLVRQSGLFERWDHDGNDRISHREFLHYAFEVWDRNDSGSVEKAEWNASLEAWERAIERRLAGID